MGSGSDHTTPGNSRRAGCGNTPQATTWAPQTSGKRVTLELGRHEEARKVTMPATTGHRPVNGSLARVHTGIYPGRERNDRVHGEPPDLGQSPDRMLGAYPLPSAAEWWACHSGRSAVPLGGVQESQAPSRARLQDGGPFAPPCLMFSRLLAGRLTSNLQEEHGRGSTSSLLLLLRHHPTGRPIVGARFGEDVPPGTGKPRERCFDVKALVDAQADLLGVSTGIPGMPRLLQPLVLAATNLSPELSRMESFPPGI